MFRNIAQNPKEEKFRKIRLNNPKINEAITSVDFALQALLEMGWKLDTVNSTDQDCFLILDPSIKVDYPTHVNEIVDTKDIYKKREEDERVARGMGRVCVGEWKSIFKD